MRAYVGQTRSRRLIARLAELGFGELTQRGELPPRRTPTAFDNGAFADHRARRAFDAARYRSDLERIARERIPLDFLVVPDRVAAGESSLAFSREWAPRCAGLAPLYLVVQDGMEAAQVVDALEPFAGLFVGGTLPWKVATGAAWVRLAHAHGRRCHVGRVGTGRRVRWARGIEADSIDSCLPLWSNDNLRIFCDALDDPQLLLPEVQGR